MIFLTLIGYLIIAISVSPSSAEYILHLGTNVSKDALEAIPKMLEHIGCLPTAQVTDIKINFYSDDESTTKLNLKFKNITTNRKLLLFIEKHQDGVTNLNFIDSNIKYFNFFNRKSSFHTHNLLIDLDKLIPAGHPLLDCSALTSGEFLSKSQQINHLVGPTNKAFAYSEAFIKYKTPKGCISYCFAYNSNNAIAHVIGLRMNDSCSPKESPIFFC